MSVFDLDKEESTVYHLVTSEVSDLDRGWISISSPLGRGLVGKVAGDEVTIRTPGGQKRFEIEKVITLHDQSE